MAKKGFRDTADRVTSKKQEEKITQAPQESKPERTTLYVIPEKYDTVKDIAYWDRKTVTELTGEAFDLLIQKYKKEMGEIKKRPEGR